MSSSSPISRVVACAGTHFRQNRRLTPDELAFVLSGLGHDLNADDPGVACVGHARTSITLDRYGHLAPAALAPLMAKIDELAAPRVEKPACYFDDCQRSGGTRVLNSAIVSPGPASSGNG